MRYILRQAALTALCFGIIYAAVLALTFVVSPDPPRDGSMDVWTAGDTLYLTSPKYAFLGRDALNVPGRKVVMVGASNTGLGFRPDRVQSLVGCAKVSNLAIGSANITEIRQMIDLVHDVQDPAAQRSDTFVIGVWFGMFVDTELLWPGAERQRGDTDLDIERYRYGFYRRTADGPVEVLPSRWLHAGVVLIRPYLLLERTARWATASLRNLLGVHPPELTDEDRETRVLTPAEKEEALDHWRQVMGGNQPISAAQVALLQDTVERLLRSGEKVVLVDLPIPAWHRDISPYQPSYIQQVQGPLFDHFKGRPGFAALKMPDLAADTDYSDEVHAKPHLTRIWAARLAEVLNLLVCPAQDAKTVDSMPIRPATANGALEPTH
jgi:hypothetical protein